MTQHAPVTTPPLRKTCEGFELRAGKLTVALSTCCDHEHYCIDVSEMKRSECLDNDHDSAGLLTTASPAQVEAYLRAALATAQKTYADTGSVRRSAHTAAEAGSRVAEPVPA